MEAGEENGGNKNLKRQRAPLSDSEDNVLTQSDVTDGQKRRCLEPAGRENRSPVSSGRGADVETKADTPIVPSVWSRVRQLTQRREGGAPLAQRCMSDPGSDSPSLIGHNKGFRENLLGENEFHQRLERFKGPLSQSCTSPSPSPTSSSTRTLSNFVFDIQQKLQGSTTPSSKQASRIRQEREQELSQLHLQPISENAWLKRRSSDSSLIQQEDDEAETKDETFTELAASGVEKQLGNGAGGGSSCDHETSAAAADLKRSEEAQLQSDSDETGIPQSRWVKEEKKEHVASGSYEGEPVETLRPESQAVLESSEGNGFSKVPVGTGLSPSKRHESDNSARGVSTCDCDDSAASANLKCSEEAKVQNDRDKGEIHQCSRVKKENEHGASLIAYEEEPGDTLPLEAQTARESSVEDNRLSKSTLGMGQSPSVLPADGEKLSNESKECLEVSNVDDEEEADVSSYGEEILEPSTDEELRLWRYPQDTVSQEGEATVAEENQKVVCSAEEQRKLEASAGEKEKRGGVSEISAISSKVQGRVKLQAGEDRAEAESCFDVSVNDQEGTEQLLQPTLSGHQEDSRSCNKYCEGPEDVATQDLQVTEGCQRLKRIQELTFKEDVDQKTTDHRVVTETQTGCFKLRKNIDAAQDETKAQVKATEVAAGRGFETEVEQEAVDGKQGGPKAEGGEIPKKVTFVLEPKLINGSSLSETNTSTESKEEISDELDSHDETNTAEVIDQMFEEVLEYAEKMNEEDEEHVEDHDSGIHACSADKDDTEPEKSMEKEDAKEEGGDDENLESNDELLTFPPFGILSPLSKSVEAVVTPMRLAASQQSIAPSLSATPEETTTPPPESAPLYSIDAYRTQRQSSIPTVQSVTPAVNRRAPEKSRPQQFNTKDKIAAFNDEAMRLQNVISQTLQALSCCTDEEHGRGSLEEAEAEKLLLVSCEKRSALLTEIARLREERSSESGEQAEDGDYGVSQQPCRGTISVSNIQLPLKVEFVCSSHNRTGRPSHYFFVLIRYGACNIIATPLATAADAQNGDTISFPTSVTLKDIRSNFEIDVEVYSLSHPSGSSCSTDRATTKSRVTPKKLLNTIARSSTGMASAALPAFNPRRSSSFCLVGSHKITLASLGHAKFPLDKMKLDSKVRRLLGDEFQEKVPFLSPLEGHIYLQLHSESHSNVQHQGFLTMFELISGFGVWHRRYFVLEGWNLYYWNHPNDKEAKEAEGSISLSSASSQCVKPVKRDSCARPFTFEIVSNSPVRQDDAQDAVSKCWFTADTKQERLDWMEKLNQALLDFHTWSRASPTQAARQQSETSGGENMRESIL